MVATYNFGSVYIEGLQVINFKQKCISFSEGLLCQSILCGL